MLGLQQELYMSIGTLKVGTSCLDDVLHRIHKAWSEHGVEALWTGQKNILLSSTPCSFQALLIRCMPID